jgi:integrase
MPRRAKLPALVHHKPSGHARVRIAGRDFYLGRHGTPEAEEAYRQLVAGWLKDGSLPGPGRPSSGRPPVPAPGGETPGPVINELLLRYLRHAKVHYRKDGEPTGQLWLVKAVVKLIREHYGRTPVAEFGPKKLKTLQAVLVAAKLSRGGVNRRVSLATRIFAWGVSEEIVPVAVHQALVTVEPLEKGRTEAPETPKVRPVSSEDVEKTLPRLSSVVRDMVTLQLLTGARPGEVCVLRPCDVDRSGEPWEYVPYTHKNEHREQDRRIFLGPQAQAVLAPYLLNREPTAYCFSPSEAVAELRAKRLAARKTPTSCGNRAGTNRAAQPKVSPGERYRAGSYRHAIHRACDGAGIARWSPNRLRHARATFLRRKYGIEAARVVLGHSTPDTTAIYAEEDLAKAREIMREVG